VNVSSPNTPGLRTLQDRCHLSELLAALRAEAGTKPILVKIAPDLTEPAIAACLEVCQDKGVAGVIATNTTLHRVGLAPRDFVLGAGGVGCLARLWPRGLGRCGVRPPGDLGRAAIVGVGGILDVADAARLFDAVPASSSSTRD
jgi:dihydroorotate dehydrogenase